MHKKKQLITLFFLCLSAIITAQTLSVTVIDSLTEQPLRGVLMDLNYGGTGDFQETDEKGFAKFEVKNSEATLYIYLETYTTQVIPLSFSGNENKDVTIKMQPLNFDLSLVEITANQGSANSVGRMRNVQDFGIYAAKKSEVILMDNMVGNLATNNPRQVYKGIAGLNIWESDGAGLQLSIGARGLDPNRTSNFNTRQNGYDISADALGYPESYYTPPTQALDRIEIVRGAASLQYGPQFGGLLNFIFKKGKADKPFEFTSENTVGSFGLLTTFNSIGGSKNGWNYYGFYQYKKGDGWRPNAQFDQQTAYASIEKTFGKLTVNGQFTRMNYLAQQSGGLADFEFNQNPLQSKRERNWFKVDWNLAALNLDYKFNENTKINSRFFYLDAARQALGELGAINRPDPLRERDLIKGTYNNFGNETRLIHRYEINGQLSTFLVGTRYYQGFTTNQQGDASDGSDADFTFLNPDNLERSSYEFPSRNISVFAENLFNITDKWTVTPGVRFEYIRTASEGFYKERVFSGGQVIFEQKFEDARDNPRSLVLAGLGIGYKPQQTFELYANFSQNYRSINFTDLAVVNPNLIIDSTLSDEKGFNIDFGIRGEFRDNAIRFDANIFYLSYQDRIGTGEIIVSDPIVIERAVAFRTNIGDARIFGFESYVEADLWRLYQPEEEDFHLVAFANFSLLHGEYTSGRSDFINNKVELIPPFSIKSGLNICWKTLKLSYQFAYTAAHFTDATNAIYVADATRGLIPAYHVQDLSAAYTYKQFKIQTGINNLTNNFYFTRRAVAYPGPGIIPSDGRNFYLTIGIQL
jgi:Fe(3+) dicitrate transport protein